MWLKGVWLQPTRVMLDLVLLRVEYVEYPEPVFVTDFRRRFGGSWELASFSWVPQSGDPHQQMFVRRHFEQAEGFAYEVLLWDRLEDGVQHFTMPTKLLALFNAMLSDMNTTADKRRGAITRQERREVVRRMAFDEHGKPVEFQFGGRWYSHELAFNREQREKSREAHSMKGGIAGTKDETTPTASTNATNPNLT
jgi:hypothetical protein